MGKPVQKISDPASLGMERKGYATRELFRVWVQSMLGGRGREEIEG